MLNVYLSSFFIQTWCEKWTDDALLNVGLKDSHTPGEYRIIGSLSNSEDFAKAFKCPNNSPMNRKPKCIIWQTCFSLIIEDFTSSLIIIYYELMFVTKSE